VPHVYILQSLRFPACTYVGLTAHLEERLGQHNAGRSSFTARYRPWRLVVAIWFPSDSLASKFEHYLKTGSGRAFAGRHFL
jgi:putative endonuclease